MAEQPARAGRRVRPQPVAHIHRQPNPPAGPGRQRQPGQRPAQPPGLDPAVAHRVIQSAMTAPVLRRQRQARQRPDRPVRAQHRIRQLEQLITASRQAATEICPDRDSTARDPASAACSSKLSITAFVVIMRLLARTNDHAEAALMPCDTPDKTANP
jgi:hypothetical protein